MARVKAMGIGAMFILLVVVIIALPMFIKFVARMTGEHYMISGFRDGPDGSDEVKNVPGAAAGGRLSTYRPDANTDYICRSPNESGTPCPEGTYCDGVDQSCKPIYVGGVAETGYYA
jgi:hypothetical protein